MKHIKIYENFVNEKMGVSNGLEREADKVVQLVMDELYKMLHVDIKGSSLFVQTQGPGYPAGEIYLKLYIDNREINEIRVTGSVTGQSLKIDDDGKYEINMALTVIGEYTNLRNTLHDIKNVDKIKNKLKAVKDEVRRVVYHEMTHIFEAYARKSTGAVELHKTDTIVYDALGKEMRKYYAGFLPKSIMDFYFLLYLAQAAEVSARVPEMYSVIKDIVDPHERYTIIKKSSVWKQAEDMSNFVAQDYIDMAKHEITIERWSDFKKTVADNMKDVLSMIDKNIKDYIILTRRGDKENVEKAKSLIPNKNKQTSIKNASTDIEKMMHEWQGIINRAGYKLKNKISKLTTA